jgi:ribosomal small subunit protein bTHX
MGKGDKKSRRGKIHIGSHGTRRPRKHTSIMPVAEAPKVKAKPVKVVEEVTKKVVKTVEPVEPAAEAVAEVKKTPRKTTKKAKEEPAEE